MKLTRILVISSALLILPIVGCAQQVPDAATTNKPSVDNLQRVVTAQTAAILSFLTMDVKPDESSVVYFVGIDNARFKRPVEPGDQLVMNVEILRVARGIWKYKAVASVDGQTAVEAELMCTIRSAADASQPAGK